MDEMSMSERRLRVLHITEAALAGVGGHMLDLAEGLPQLGCDVHVLYSARRIDEMIANRLPDLSNVSVEEIEMRRGPHPSDLHAKKAIISYIHRHGPFDIIHAHSTKAGGLARLKSICKFAKVVYTPNGIFTMNPTVGIISFQLAKTIERILGHRSDAIVAVSPEEEQHMLDIGLPRDKVEMIANGLRSIQWRGQAEVRNENQLSEDEFIFGFVGRMAPQKNPLLLLKAFARLQPNDRPLRLAMVGTGPLEHDARQLATGLGIADRVSWLGYKTAEQSMPAFDVFVMPSQYEGMPYVLMEAVSIGMPVVATKVGGTSLSIEHRRNGLVVPLENPEELARSLQRLVDSPDLCAEFSSTAIEKSAEFSVDRMVRKTFQLYCKLLGRDVHSEPLESSEKLLA